MHLVRHSSARALLPWVVRHTLGHGVPGYTWMLLHTGRMACKRRSHTRHHVFGVSMIHSVDIDVSSLRTISCACVQRWSISTTIVNRGRKGTKNWSGRSCGDGRDAESDGVVICKTREVVSIAWCGCGRARLALSIAIGVVECERPGQQVKRD